jgi:hypothetical protein
MAGFTTTGSKASLSESHGSHASSADVSSDTMGEPVATFTCACKVRGRQLEAPTPVLSPDLSGESLRRSGERERDTSGRAGERLARLSPDS